jgi:hypothetical protein
MRDQLSPREGVGARAGMPTSTILGLKLHRIHADIAYPMSCHACFLSYYRIGQLFLISELDITEIRGMNIA